MFSGGKGKIQQEQKRDDGPAMLMVVVSNICSGGKGKI
jgi:hypothetical protein